MKLISNWRQVLKKSAASWMGVASAVAGSVEIADQIIPGFIPLLPPNVAGTVSVVLAAAVPVARVINQNLGEK